VLAAGLCFVPAAAGDAGAGQWHGGGHGDVAGYAAPVQAQWHGGGDGSPGGDPGGGWGGSHGDPGQGQGGWGGSGGQGQGGGWGDGGAGGGSGPAQPATPQVATPQVAVPATPTSPESGGGDGAQHGHGNSWGGSGDHGSNGNSWGGSHGDGQGSGSDNGHHSGWGSGNGNGNSSGGSGSSATPASSKASSSSSSSSSSPSSATPAVTTAASGSGSSATPANSSPASVPATTTPVAVSVNPAQPAPSSSTPAPNAGAQAGGGAPTGKHTQKTSSRSGARARSPRTRAGRAGSAAGASPFRGITGASPAVARALTAGATSPAAAPAATRRRTRRHKPATASLPQPLNTLGHDLSSVPTLVNGLVPLPVPDWSKPIIFALLLVCALLAFRAWLTGHRARRIEAQREQLAVDLASIQAALIPEIPTRLGGLDVSVAYRPADGPGAGGDFYDAFALDADRVAIIVGDVSGHGRDALGRAAHMHYTLRAYVEMGLEPRAALKLAGRVLGADKDDLFTTVAVAVHDAAAGTLSYATAGHPAPVLLGPAAHEPLTRCASPALGWGVATGRRQTTVPFSEGARACFFTDGITEARVQNELLGRDRLGRMLRELGPDAGAKELLESVQRQAPAVHDDMAACIVAATSGTVLSELRTEELEVDPRQIGSGQAEQFLNACGVSPAEAEAVVADAGEIASEAGVALLRVEIDGGEARATATGPAPGRPELQQA